MKFENTEVWGFEHALRGMRNPKESWDRSDSHYGCWEYGAYECDCDGCGKGIDRADNCTNYNKYYIVGENDLKLAQQLIKAGSEHRKFMRQIFVSVDITAPLYWWKEFDTYKVGTVANSTSTMHKIGEKEFSFEDFSCEFLLDNEDLDWGDVVPKRTLENVIHCLNIYREKYLHSKTKPMKEEAKRSGLIKTYWWQMIQLLPSSYNQKRTVTMNYENLLGMCSKGQRRFHKLNEWSGIDKPDVPNFISWARSLPYAKELIFLDESEGNNNASSCDK